MTIANVFAERYASSAMIAIWEQEKRILLERQLWIAALKAMKKLGRDIPDGAIEAYEQVADHIDLESMPIRELHTRHDVKARIEEINNPAASGRGMKGAWLR